MGKLSYSLIDNNDTSRSLLIFVGFFFPIMLAPKKDFYCEIIITVVYQVMNGSEKNCWVFIVLGCFFVVVGFFDICLFV